MKELIRSRAFELGFDACGFSDAQSPESRQAFQRWLAKGHHGGMEYLQRNAAKRSDLDLVLPGVASVICLAVSYYPGDTTQAAPTRSSPGPEADPCGSLGGTVARYARYADYHTIVGERLKVLVGELERLAGSSGVSLWYVDTGPILERDLAQRSGIGFVGKHTGLISRRLGNWTFLAEILTRIRFEPDRAERNHCGSCTRCLAACPTQAIVAPFELDARKCISYLTIENKGPIPEPLRPLLGDRIYGCDDCLAVCPWNRFAREARMMANDSRPDLARPDLLELLRLDEPGFKLRFAGTPILRAKRRGLLRNVCVALGNSGNPSALPALERAAQDTEPLIAEHASWAIQRLQNPPDRGGPLCHSNG